MAVQYAFSQITTTGLKLAVDAADPLSYPGSGTSWTDVTGNGFTGTISSSISFATTNRGALVSSNSSSAVSFSGSAADFGQGSFTIEMAFSPSVISGTHWLYSKNSGSFPNFGAFITGSSGSGRIVAFYNVSSTVSSSVTTAVGSIVTGSNYLLDVTYAPASVVTAVYLNSNLQTTSGANGIGSLSTSASLLLLNNTTASNAGTVGNLYNFKVYNPLINSSNIRKNYNSMCSRFGLPLALYTPPAPFLLDLYPGAAAAYSLRKLTDFYGGSAIRVRRSSDNTEQDIGFDGNGDLNTAALLSFVGAGDGFVTTWYDQSGNAKNATQTAAANQPQIVSSGSVISDGGKPTINQTSTQHLSVNNVVFISSFFVVKVNSQVAVNYFIATTSSNGSGGFFANGDFDGVNGFGGFDGSNVRSLTGEDLNRHIAYYNTFGGNLNVSKDNNSITNIGVFASSLTLTLLLGRATSSGLSLQGNSQEMIFYNSNQASNRTGIQSNINSYYSIY